VPEATTEATESRDLTGWQKIVARYTRPHTGKSIMQICTSVVPLLLTYWLMYLSLGVSYWLTLALALPAAGLSIRTFIIMHDCGHGSFFPSRTWNDITGFVTGVLTATPYAQWRRDHAIHHATSGDLEQRGVGDVNTLTVKEYLALSRFGRLKYRIYRNPLILLIIGPITLWINHRIPARKGGVNAQDRWSVWLTNLAIAGLFVGFSVWIGWWTVLKLYLPVFMISTSTGIFLFYVQHQFEDAYWDRKPVWEYPSAALYGSSHFKLPRILRWFTGNIGLHHVHHLSPKIPNYSLQSCHDENPAFQKVVTLTLRDSWHTLALKLWDEDQKRMITWRGFRQLQKGS
jgi:omega-6 fatty acid desaturase (delta-12 desaturase)